MYIHGGQEVYGKSLYLLLSLVVNLIPLKAKAYFFLKIENCVVKTNPPPQKKTKNKKAKPIWHCWTTSFPWTPSFTFYKALSYSVAIIYKKK